MICELVHDPIFLAAPSERAEKADLHHAQNLLDTLRAHRATCVGMAANMIGCRKRIIVFLDETTPASPETVMLNPEIVWKNGEYDAEESCLSLLGAPRPCKRYRSIRVRYQTLTMQTREKRYEGWTAQIIQHEIDHCNGRLI